MMAARNYENFLQVGLSILVERNQLIHCQCAIPVFEGLLPEPHNHRVLQLLFTFTHWHGLAKLRLHTDITLPILDDETTVLGKQLRGFESSTCSTYPTRELKREMRARERRQGKKPGGSMKQDRKLKTFNLQTYKTHSLGDYVSTIQRLGTTDSYTSAIVSQPTVTIAVKGLMFFML